MMKVKVRLFASFREALGRDSIELDSLPAGSTLGDVRRLLDERYPALRGLVGAPVLDLEYAGEDTPIRDGAEVAFIPPVSGG